MKTACTFPSHYILMKQLEATARYEGFFPAPAKGFDQGLFAFRAKKSFVCFFVFSSNLIYFY